MVKKITVIGGSGFVGTNLCRALTLKQQDFEIIDLKISREFHAKSKIADVRDVQSLRSAITGDVVINLAAIHRDDIKDKAEYQRTNVHGAENIATVCEELGIHKIIFTSSVAVYGFAAPRTDESGCINPFNEYGRTKFEAEEKLRFWHKNGERELIIVRPTVIFGEGNRGNVYNLFNQISSRKFMMIGRGENKKSMAYIGNIVAFLELCLDTKVNYGIYNYTDTPDLTMNELVSEVRRTLHDKSGVGLRLPYWLGGILGYFADGVSHILGINLPLSSIRVKKFVTDTEFSSAKSNLNGFAAPYSLHEGISRTLTSEFLAPDSEREVFFTE